ncbi:MAG: hypothetical protein AAFY98_11180 [Verrucomicrobiota bacterium]
MPETFRAIFDGPGDSSWNMAVDEALLTLATGPVVRFYDWESPDVTIGYFQLTSVVPENRSFIRRYTGGGLVDHAQDITYTVVLPREHPIAQSGTAASYNTIHQAVATALQSHGYAIEVAQNCPDSDDPACFQKPVKYDLLLEGKKCAGAAQRRNKIGCLHQGSIVLPQPFPKEDIKGSLCQEFSAMLRLQPNPSRVTKEESHLAKELNRTRYSTKDWNHAR